MLTSNKKIKVLLYGNISSKDFRSRLLLDLLHSSGKYCISQSCPNFYTKNIAGNFSSVEKIFILFYWLELSIKAAFADVIYLLPMNTAFVKSAIYSAKFLKKKLVVEMYISLYDSWVRDRKRIDSESKLAKSCIKKDILALKESDYLIHTSSQELTYWEQILNTQLDREKVFIAPLCNVSSLVAKRKWRQDGVLRICWWGTFIPLHGLDSILQAMKILQERRVQFTCDLFGVDNHSFAHFTAKVESYQFGSCVSLRKDLNFADTSLPNYLVDNCDLALGIFGNTEKAYHAVPNKVIEALSMGIATLTMNSPALGEFFNSEVDLWTCEPAAEAIAASILAIANGTAHPVNWEQTRQKVLSTFSVARYKEVVSEVLAKATNSSLLKETESGNDSDREFERLVTNSSSSQPFPQVEELTNSVQ